MNSQVRSYLIKSIREGKPYITYTDVVNGCHLKIEFDGGMGSGEIGRILGDIAEFEHQNGRPLLSSFVIRKDTKEHGEGFYRIAQELGIGSAKKLLAQLYGFEEAERCKSFWLNDQNYENYYSTTSESPLNFNPEFFTDSDLDFFKNWQYKPYNRSDKSHVEAKNILIRSVWEKSLYLGKELIARIPGFSLDGRKYWSQRGWAKQEDGTRIPSSIFKPYTWVKVFRNTDKGKDIFFTFGIDAHPTVESFVFKIDCQKTRDSNLSQSQIKLFQSLVPSTAVWNEIPFSNLLTEDWDSLLNTCASFITNHLAHYDAIVNVVWGESVPPSLFQNKLIKRDKPDSGLSELPEVLRSFTGSETDFFGKAREQKDLGDAGENLVLAWEKEFLRNANRPDLAESVEKVKDGEGFDIKSFWESGHQKFIEVKTTKGDKLAPFYISENELAFLKSTQDQNSIYRIFNYDPDNNFGEFFEITGQIEDQILLQPVQYKVYLKKKD